MDWITGMQRALDYIEEHLTEPIDYEKIGERAYLSGFYFQRIFGVLCGCTLGEYIRSRRMTLAGSELLSSDVKVIDLALKYGYETPESFTRAFTRFHGVTPSVARTGRADLKSFSRLSVKLSLQGGSIMTYRIEHCPSMRVVVKSEKFKSDGEENGTLIPAFWDKCRADGIIDTLYELCSDESVFGKAIIAMCESETDENGFFEYSIGVQHFSGEIPPGFRIKEIPAHTWAVFPCKGAMPHGIQDGWRRIYAEFFPASGYRQIPTQDFEVYPQGDMSSEDYESAIRIPIEKSSQSN